MLSFPLPFVHFCLVYLLKPVKTQVIVIHLKKLTKYIMPFVLIAKNYTESSIRKVLNIPDPEYLTTLCICHLFNIFKIDYDRFISLADGNGGGFSARQPGLKAWASVTSAGS